LIEVPAGMLLVENTLFTWSGLAYLAATAGYLVNIKGKNEWGTYAPALLRLALVVHSGFIIVRAVNVGRVPFVGHFEFGNLFIWASALVYACSEWRAREGYAAIGPFFAPLLVLYLGYLTVVPVLIPRVTVSRVHQPLRLVLQSDWLTIHVITSVFGYAGFTLAMAWAAGWFARHRLAGSPLGRALPGERVVEEYMYRAAALGFLFQTLMIITGAIWADLSWGRYWGWDPKEMWSLITWLIFAGYLHARLTRGWRGKRAVALVAIGFLAMLFTWIGVAWLLPGIHSFG
jgi:cytochrome c-type biogenesis protein CcsB